MASVSMAAAAPVLAVAAGSAAGGVLRYAAGCWITPPAGAMPWATFAVNVSGSFAIGMLAAWTAGDGRPALGPGAQHFLMTGVCGGYTTFSTFSLHELNLLRAGAVRAAGTNAALSVACCIAAAWLGHAAGTAIRRTRFG
jgi:CrcB protein